MSDDSAIPRRSRRPARRLLSAVSVSAALLTAPAAWAECRLEHMAIPVRIVDRRPIATLTLNGVEVPMLVDSGAFYSMLNASTATQLNLPLRSLPFGLRIQGYTGRLEAKQTRVQKVGLFGAELENVEFIVGGNELGAGIMGVLGRNILAAGDTEYDLAHGMVWLSFPKGDCDDTNFAHWAGAAPVVVVPLDREKSRGDTEIRIEVRINGKRNLAMLDTGAPQTALTLRTARRAGIEEPDLKLLGRVGGAGEGRTASWTGPVATFEVGGEKIIDNRLEIDDVFNAEHDLLVGLDYFLSHRLYVSRLQRRLYVTWNGGPVFAQDHATPGQYDARYASLPQDIPNDDADALARRGNAAIASGDYPRALQDLDRACELAPERADNHAARARLHLLMGQPRLALDDLDTALRLEPGLAEARLQRASVRAKQGDRDGAQADLAQLDATQPPSLALRAGMGQMYANFDRVPEALRQFDLWLSSHPADARRADVLNNRCWLRARLNLDLPLALQDCKEAVDMDEGASAYLDSLGWAYLRLGDPAKAKRAFDAAIKLQARPYSLYGRGLAQLRLDAADSGAQDLAAARKLRPSIENELRKLGFEFVDGVARPPPSGS